jgi:hypothetical protein
MDDRRHSLRIGVGRSLDSTRLNRQGRPQVLALFGWDVGMSTHAAMIGGSVLGVAVDALVGYATEGSDAGRPRPI